MVSKIFVDIFLPRSFWGKNRQPLTPPGNYITAKAPENEWLEDDYFPFGALKGLFSGVCAVSLPGA